MLGLSKLPARGALVGLSLLFPAEPDPHATSVVSYVPGGGTGIFLAAPSLGAPRGLGLFTGSFDVTSLGTGGSLTLGFDVTLVDGPGADFTVFENGFFDLGLAGVHSEEAFVEVSTDGVTFARFPNAYDGPAGPLSPFATTPVGTYAGLAGGRPTLANADTNEVDALDPTVSGGTSFDLADLGRTAAVQSGAVRLDAVHFVRLIDVVDGDLDSDGDSIWDNSGPGGSADIDGVSVLNHADNQVEGRPEVELWIDASNRLHVVFEDPDGLLDIVDLSATVALFPVDLFAFLSQFTLIDATQARTHLVTRHALTGTGLRTDLTVSVRDAAGRFSADQVTIQG